MDVAALGRRARFQSAQQRRRPKKKTGFASHQEGGNKKGSANDDGDSSDDFSFKSDVEEKPIQIGNRIISPIKPVLPKDSSSSSEDEEDAGPHTQDDDHDNQKSSGMARSSRRRGRRHLGGGLGGRGSSRGGRQRSTAAAAAGRSVQPASPSQPRQSKRLAALNLFQSRKEPPKSTASPTADAESSSSEDDEEDRKEAPKLKPRKLFDATSPKAASDEEDEEEQTHDDSMVERNGAESKTVGESSSSPARGLFPFPLHPEVDEQSTSESEDELVFSSPKKRRRPARKGTTTKTKITPSRRRKRQKKVESEAEWEELSSEEEEGAIVLLDSEEDDEEQKSLEQNHPQNDEDNVSTGTREEGDETTKTTPASFTPIKSSTIPQVFTYEQVSVDQFRSPDRNNTISVSSGDEPQPPGATATTSPRRSPRARVPTLEYWKNEKVVYGFDQETKAPVPKAIVRATGNVVTSRQGVEDRAPFDSTALRQTHDYTESETTVAWDVDQEERRDIQIVAFRNQVEYQDMNSYMDGSGDDPVQGASTMEYVPPKNSKFPKYLMGNLKLPCNSMIKTQRAGSVIQVFTVVRGQKGAFEFALGMQDQPFFGTTASRYLMSPGDTFRIPPGNYFRFQNHSPTRECHLTWTLIHEYSEKNCADETPRSAASPKSSEEEHSKSEESS